MKFTCGKELINKKEYNGMVNFTDLKELLNRVTDGDTIYLLDDYYYGKFYINTPNLTIIGNDNSSVLDYDVKHGDIIRDIDGGDGVKTYGTTGSASTTILPHAINIKISKVTFKNSYIRKSGDRNTQTVAIKTSALGGRFTDCQFIGTQDTLYVDESDNVFDNCYIEGDVDFIFGSGDAIFKNCEINLLQILDSKAYLCAPNTYERNKYGYLFYNCEVKGDGTNEKYLGRAWYPSKALDKVKPRAMFMNCHFEDNIKLEMITMHEGDPTDYQCYVSNCIQNEEEISNFEDEKIEQYYKDYINSIR